MPQAPFNVEEAEDSPGFLLWQATVVWQRLIQQALEPHQVAHAQFVLLASLLWLEGKGASVTQVLLARHTKLDKMTVSQALKKMALLGQVQRAEHKQDSRAKSVVLTAKGRALARKLVPVVEGVDADFFGRLAKPRRQALTELLRGLAV